MRRTQNKVSLIGFVGKEPNFSYVGDSKIPFAAFSLITHDLIKVEDVKTANTINIKSKDNFHKVVCWRKNAELVNDYLKTKAYIYVEGSISTNEYRDGRNILQRSVEINAEKIIFLDKGRSIDAMLETAVPDPG
ncbi:single-stranded DNA-binding protein [Pedobacter jeongneungensis]|uniref:single-stranded DNA-binding protein n=1 Tax=Pedobacter jeongneungensis TaxID=947309 RepID=UPI0013B3AC37|nr:single-stranded DNA-binding protein [Pedobacter jeongneungensis]